MNKKGMFIAIDGNDGAGKTTLIQELVKQLRDEKWDVVHTREPGGTELGGRIREIVLDGKTPCGDMTLFLMFMADRAHHIETVIKPAIERGQIVITDRHLCTTYTHQVGGGTIPEHAFQGVVDAVLGDFQPDLSIYMDCDVDVAMERIRARGGNSDDRFDQKLRDFHEKGRLAGKHYTENLVQNGFVVDASGTPEESLNQISQLVRIYLNRRYSPSRSGVQYVVPHESGEQKTLRQAIEHMATTIPDPETFLLGIIRHRVEEQGLLQASGFIFSEFTVDERVPDTDKRIRILKKPNATPESFLEYLLEPAQTEAHRRHMVTALLHDELSMMFAKKFDFGDSTRRETEMKPNRPLGEVVTTEQMNRLYGWTEQALERYIKEYPEHRIMGSLHTSTATAMSENSHLVIYIDAPAAPPLERLWVKYSEPVYLDTDGEFLIEEALERMRVRLLEAPLQTLG